MTLGCDTLVSRSEAMAVSDGLLERIKTAGHALPDNVYEPPSRIVDLTGPKTELLRLNVAGRSFVPGVRMSEAEIAKAAKVQLFQVRLLFDGKWPGSRAAKKLMAWCDLDSATLHKHAQLLADLNERAKDADVQAERHAQQLREEVGSVAERLSLRGSFQAKTGRAA